jgi:hypothetical protein
MAKLLRLKANIYARYGGKPARLIDLPRLGSRCRPLWRRKKQPG